MHLAIDGYGASPEKLEDTDTVYRFLDEFPDAIGMNKIVPPQVYTYHGKTPEDWGVSGFVIIAESHISVHTWPEIDYAAFDIFTCGACTPEGAVEHLRRELGADRFEVRKIRRGLVT